MAKNLFITATEARSGKSAICLGVMELLLRSVERVCFFRPLINGEMSQGGGIDHDINLVSSHFKLPQPYKAMYAYTAAQANTMIMAGKHDEVIEGIVTKYKDLERESDFVLCEGTDFLGSTSAFEFDINAEISNDLGSPILLVANANKKTVDETLHSIEMAVESMLEKGCDIVATLVNRVDPTAKAEIVGRLEHKSWGKNQLIYALPNEPRLGNPTVREIAKLLNARVLYGEENLDQHVYSFTVAAMQMHNFLERIQHGTLIITPGDRADIIVACMATVSSTAMPQIAGILLTGDLIPEEPVRRLVEGFSHVLPILSVEQDTFPTARIADNVHAIISPEDTRKIMRALEVFENNVAMEELGQRILQRRITIITPKMFEYTLLQQAKTHKQHIVLPEGEDERILRAAEILLRRDVVDVTVLGDENEIRKRISRMGLRMETLRIVDMANSPSFDDYVTTYYDLRKHKGITRAMARDTISDANYFATMMVFKGHADGMVSGAVHTTADTIRPAFEVIRTKPGVSLVSSVFFMCLKDRVLVYADCAVNTDPNARELAEIAISSAQTAMTFGIEPRVAMLSYSTGESGRGEDVDKVRQATDIAKHMATEACPGLQLEGPMQYDTAIDPDVARAKMPQSGIAGKATVFIFPDLNTGNNTYKAVQRSAKAIAVGPILQGLNKPVNDLSRGSSVGDVVNTVAITAVQAQAEKGLR